MAEQLQPKQLQVKATDEKLKGEYANVMQVIHTKEEFLLDFLNIFPPTGTLTARIIVSPNHFKRMVTAMQENLKQYETQFGSVAPSEPPHTPIGFQSKD